MKNKLCFVLFVFVLCFVFRVENVSARMLTIDEIYDKVVADFIGELNDYVDGFEEYDYSYSLSKDDVNKKFDFYFNNEKLVSFNYTNEYIEYDNRNGVITQDNFQSELYSVMCMGGIVQAILDLSGNEDRIISDDDISIFKDTYDEYGLQLITEYYEISGNDDGVEWSSSGEFIKYFKVSLDTDKIDALVETYGSESSRSNGNSISSLVPTLEVSSISDNMISIDGYVLRLGVDVSDGLYCDIYRSIDRDNFYEIVGESVDCLYDFSFNDSGLKPDTTYYYKAKVQGSINFSNVLAVTTSGNYIDASISSGGNNISVNPKTEGNMFVISIIVLGGLSFIVSILLFRKFKTYI